VTQADEKFMRRALQLAERGRGKVHPNPMVGCVLVRNGRIVGSGWHTHFGGPHAEPGALKQAGSRARGATAYVTLEPCCYFGKTPACTEALIAAGIKRVVAATTDPNPRVAGKGLRRLRAHGIKTVLGLMREEALALNRPFWNLMQKKRPYVILKAAASLDGRIETASGQSKWITSAAARAVSRRMRSQVDAILVGADTVIRDNPRLTASGGRHPLRIVLDSRLRTPPRAKVYTGPGQACVATTKAPNGRVAKDNFIRLKRRSGGLDLKALLLELGRRGVACLLVEGGPKVHTSFLEANLVDEVALFIAPKLIGGSKARSFYEGAGVKSLPKASRLKNVSYEVVGDDLLVRGRVR
jgi:diaminohydroxyphosphoribosylaminopyrimidine deaminase/5-amino-6-(5-phosphoribosylamino)uracil reductase